MNFWKLKLIKNYYIKICCNKIEGICFFFLICIWYNKVVKKCNFSVAISYFSNTFIYRSRPCMCGPHYLRMNSTLLYTIFIKVRFDVTVDKLLEKTKIVLMTMVTVGNRGLLEVIKSSLVYFILFYIFWSKNLLGLLLFFFSFFSLIYLFV